jgi:hypothetical protein
MRVDRRLLAEHAFQPEVRIDACADRIHVDQAEPCQRLFPSAPLREVVLHDGGFQLLDERGPAADEIVERFRRQLRDLLDCGVGAIGCKRALVEPAGVLWVAAQDIAVGDADVSAGQLLLPEKIISAAQCRNAELQRARFLQRGAEMPLAEQTLHAGQHGLRADILRNFMKRRWISTEQAILVRPR